MTMSPLVKAILGRETAGFEIRMRASRGSEAGQGLSDRPARCSRGKTDSRCDSRANKHTRVDRRQRVRIDCQDG